jgi:hypothetical protein
MEQIISKLLFIISKSFYVLVFMGGLYWVVAIIRVFTIERKINKIYEKQNKRIGEIKNQPIAMSVINGQIARVKEDNVSVLEELQRKRRFILDKIPLLRK